MAVEEAGPVRAAIALRGQLDDGAGHVFGRFTARVWAWAGSPLISLTFRVFQETDHPVAIVYELLTGALPPPARRTLAEAGPNLPFPPGLPVELTAVIRRALATEPAARYPSGGEFIAALRQAAGQMG